jgi:GntR family transcriptional regulator, transcriptional repressor for pyruvate dehydrogenase complex
VAEAILELIRERELREGDMLPPTAELAATFGVSRPVIREALAELAGRGLIERQQGRESILRLPGSERIAQLLDYQVEHTDITDAQLHELRKALEMQSARLAARNATTNDVEELERWLTDMREAAQDIEASLTADIAIHQAVAAATHNPLFALILDAVGPLLVDSRRRAWRSYRSHGGAYEQVVARHAQIVEAIRGHDPEAAEAAMADDLLDVEQLLEKGRRTRRAQAVRNARS